MSYSVGRFDHILLGNERSQVALSANAAGTALVLSNILTVSGTGTSNFSGDVYVSGISGGTREVLIQNPNSAAGSLGQLRVTADVGTVITGIFAAIPAASGARVNVTATNGYMLLGTLSAHDLQFWTNTEQKMTLFSTGTLSLGTIDTTGQLVVDQASTTAAIPVVSLEQRDVDQDWFEFDTTIGTGNATEAVGVKTLTTTHFLKVTITGVGARYFPVGTIA